MREVVLTAWKPDGGHRSAAWAHNRTFWESWLNIDVFEGGDDTELFSRAAARNDASARAGDWDVALIVDADARVETAAQARSALDLARSSGQLVYAHDHLRMLTEEGTGRVLAGQPLRPEDGERYPNTWSSVLAVTRTLWDAVGGQDERFPGWGWQDLAFMAACRAIGGGFHRVPGDAYHLWHPRTWEENEGSPDHNAAMVLGRRYLDAMGDRSAMRAILAER